MQTDKVADLFKVYMDAPDQTFVDNAQIAQWLTLAYDDFRRMVIEKDPYVYAEKLTVTLSAKRKIDLSSASDVSTPIMGASALAGRELYQLVNIYCIESASEPDKVKYRLYPSRSPASVHDGMASYALRGTELVFDEELTETIRIDYIPFQSSVFTTTTISSSPQFIDDLGPFHDLIALIAYLQYAIVDAAENPQLTGQLARRIAALKTYLDGRPGGVVQHVVDIDWY